MQSVSNKVRIKLSCKKIFKIPPDKPDELFSSTLQQERKDKKKKRRRGWNQLAFPNRSLAALG